MTKEQHDRINKVREARDFLSEQGYYVNNLWMIDDVLAFERYDGNTPDLNESEAMWILNKVLSSEWITEQVFVSIGEHIELVLDNKSNNK